MGKAKNSPQAYRCRQSPDLRIDSERLFDQLALGIWSPNVDLCETRKSVLVRIELPGVNRSDISLTIQDGTLRVQGIKIEPPATRKLHCYYCLERSFGKFDRSIPIDQVVDGRHARASLNDGVLIIELPKLVNRRGVVVQVPIEKG